MYVSLSRLTRYVHLAAARQVSLERLAYVSRRFGSRLS
jgi:hypothetical protein